MPTLTIKIKMDNAAFEEQGPGAAYVLRDWLGRFAAYETLPPIARLRDLNGNTVGEAKVTR